MRNMHSSSGRGYAMATYAAHAPGQEMKQRLAETSRTWSNKDLSKPPNWLLIDINSQLGPVQHSKTLIKAQVCSENKSGFTNFTSIS